MEHKRLNSLIGLVLLLTLTFALSSPALAQESQPGSATPQPLLLYTQYPSRMIGLGETVTLPLKLRAGVAQVVSLEVQGLPEGWTATFRGGSQIVDAVYVDGVADASVDLRLETPSNAEPGKYELKVIGSSKREQTELIINLTIKEKLPPRLSLTTDGLPTKRGTPNSAVTFTLNLKNEGGEDLIAELSATQPENVQVTIQSGGQDVTELELAPNETKNLTVKATPLVRLEAGNYSFSVQAIAGDVSAQIDLTVEVVGQGRLSVSAPEGRLSAQAYAGQDNPLKIELTNSGTAPLRGIQLTSTTPSGWSITFDQAEIAEIPAGETVEVTAQVKPPEKAVAGDYVITINARPVDSQQESADFRITVRTSTLWGVAGIGLIALAVGAVGAAVVRFGRR
jgi:uncharacterized membrane protein